MNASQVALCAKLEQHAHDRVCKVQDVGIRCSYSERLKKIRAAAEVLDENEPWIRLVLLREARPCDHAGCKSSSHCKIAEALLADAAVAS